MSLTTEHPKRIELQLRIPQDARDWVREQARRNGRSGNSEIVQIIRAAMARDAKAEA